MAKHEKDTSRDRKMADAPADGGGARLEAGEELKGARKRRSISLETAARELNIRRDFLQAIENGDVAALPDPAYSVGFVRSYARYLNLDASDLVARFKVQVAGAADTDHLYFPTPMRQSRMPIGVLVIMFLVVAGLAYGSWVLYAQQDDGAGGQAAATANADKGKPQTASASKATPPAGSAVSARVPVGGKTGDGNPTARGAGKKAGETPDRGSVAAKLHAPTGNQQVVLRATSNTWVRVRDASNQIVFSRILREGDQYVVPRRAGIVVDIGNAGGLQIVLNGKVLKPVGPSNMPVYNISLSPEALRKRQEAANTPSGN